MSKRDGRTHFALGIILLILLASCSPRVNTTLLHWASREGHADIVSDVIRQGIEVDLTDGRNRTALSYAVESGNTEIASVLLASGADAGIETPEGDSLLHLAADGADLAMANLLLEAGTPLGALDARNRSALHRAFLAGNREVFLRLLPELAVYHAATPREGDGWTVTDWRGYTPMHWAAELGDVELGEALVAAGASLDRLDVADHAPVHLAAERGYSDFVRLLLDAGADATLPWPRLQVLEAVEGAMP